MRQFSTVLILGLIAFAACGSDDRNAAIFHPWCADDANHFKSRLDPYRHVLVARVDEYSWENLAPRLTPHHFKATVVSTYKGDWKISEQISFVHHVDGLAPAGPVTNGPSGDLVIIFTSEHTTNEITLDTGEWVQYRDELAPGLEYLYPSAANRAWRQSLQFTRLVGRVAELGSLGIMCTHKFAQSFLFAVFFAVSAAADSAPVSSAPATAPIVAPTEYDWTFFYRGTRYGLQQFGPVAIYPRNAHVIWHSRAYRIPVTIPWALVIAACVVFAPVGFIALRKKGRGDA